MFLWLTTHAYSEGFWGGSIPKFYLENFVWKKMFETLKPFFLSHRWLVLWHCNWMDSDALFYFAPPTVDPIPIFALSSGDINFRFMKEQPQGLPLEALLAPSGVQKHHPWRDFCSRFDRLRCKNCLLTCFFPWVCFFVCWSL